MRLRTCLLGLITCVLAGGCTETATSVPPPVAAPTTVETPTQPALEYPDLRANGLYYFRKDLPIAESCDGETMDWLSSGGYFRALRQKHGSDGPWYQARIADDFGDDVVWIESSALNGAQLELIDESEPEEPPARPRAVAAQPRPQVQTVTPQPRSQTQYVWIGKTGTKYHKESCSTLKGKGRRITLQEAKHQGRTPCGWCYR